LPPATPTVAPSATPLPTPGPLNEPVAALPKGGASCEDYPCPEDVAGWEARVQVPAGFSAEYFALVDDQPNSMAFGPDGLLYVAQMNGTIWTIDASGNATLFYEGLNVPVGTAFQPGTARLYVSDRVDNTEAQVSVIDTATKARTILFDGVPCCYAGMHAANGIAFGPDGYGYVAVGAIADHGELLNTDEQAELHPWEASILRFSPDGSEIENFARGIRNAYDIAWDGTGNLYATNNGPDYGPPDTFHRIVPGGEHGYPWFECDHCFGPAPDGIDIVPVAHEFIPHSAPTGVTAYLSEQFPGYYNNLFAVLWSAFEGAQKVVRFAPGATDAVDFATGFAAPIDATVGPDGSLYVCDWATGVIFKITYTG
jgi:glucose/arabinose dehydrogenase